MRHVTVVLPAYNEEAGIRELLRRIARAMPEAEYSLGIIVVDDGSDDDTASILLDEARTLPILIERHERNRGYGKALETGLEAAASKSGAIVTMDADNSHDPALIPLMLAELDRGHDIVIASRFEPGGGVEGVPWNRRVLSWIAGPVLRMMFRLNDVRDCTSGYRAFRAEFVRDLFASSDREPLITEVGFTGGFELLLKAKRLGARVSEVPFVLEYGRKEGPSKMNVVHTVRRYFALARVVRSLRP